jgi:hypothetical protein
VNKDEAAFPHIGQQYPDYAQRQIKIRSQIGERNRQATPAQYLSVLRLEAHRIGRQAADGGNQSDQVDALSARPGPAPGQRIRSDHGTRILVQPPVILHVHEITSLLRLWTPGESARPGALRLA